MERPKKEDYDFNDCFEGVRYANDMNKYADKLEAQLNLNGIIKQNKQCNQFLKDKHLLEDQLLLAN